MLNILDIISYHDYNIDMEYKCEIGKKIKEQRLNLNLSMDEVAQKIGVTRTTLWSIENGSGNYSIDSLIKLSNLLNLSIEIDSPNKKNKRKRASRINSKLDKKINRFIIMSIEQYASSANKSSQETYRLLNKYGIIKELVDDYEDMHGMSTYLINEYIDKRLEGEMS